MECLIDDDAARGIFRVHRSALTSPEVYAAERDRLIEPDQPGPRPSGGVGGTRVGVKCLHAHLAWWLVGGNDPVGAWVAERISPTLAELGLLPDFGGEVV